MKYWSHLEKGDYVDVVAPASPCPRENLEAGCRWIESVGLIPRYPRDIIKGDVFFATTLKEQLEFMKEAVYSDSRALWSLRGGYGSMRLIPYMEKWKAPKHPKFFMGFSDVTALHLFFTQNWGWSTLHGRNVSAMSTEKKSKDRKEIQDMLFGKKEELIFPNLKPLNELAQKNKTISGKITGGNLKLLQTSIGTSWELEAKGKILFLEDIGERGYAVDRMLEQLWQAKIIHKGLKALVLGDFIEGEEKDGRDLTGLALRRFAEKAPFPVLRGMKAGHGDVNFTVPFNTRATLITGKKAVLTAETGGR